MKKITLLLAAAALAWLTGCQLGQGGSGGRDPAEPGDDSFYPTAENMADVYYLTETTVSGVPLAPSEISGAIILTREKTYSIDFTIPGEHIIRSGTYTISQTGTDDFIVMDGSGLWHIRDDGLKLESLWIGLKGNPTTFVCTRT